MLDNPEQSEVDTRIAVSSAACAPAAANDTNMRSAMRIMTDPQNDEVMESVLQKPGQIAVR